MTGFVDANRAYEHEEYTPSRGYIRLVPASISPSGVHYEEAVIRLSDIEGYLIQNIHGFKDDDISALKDAAAKRF
jgi:hypothetical protein